MATGRDAIPGRAATEAASLAPEDAPSLIAHRGFAGDRPENTAGAIRAAARTADWIEIDCRPTADGAVAVFHDHRLDRCTPGTGLVSEVDGDELFSTPVLGGGTVLSLPEALSLVPPDTGVVLDLKGRTGTAPTGENERWEWVDRAVSVAEDTPNPLLVSTFWEEALAAVDGRLPTAYLFESDVEAAFSVADRHDCVAIHPPAELVVGGAGSNGEDLLARANEAGLAVNAWTVTDTKGAAALAAAGVDGVIADHGDVLAPRVLARSP